MPNMRQQGATRSTLARPMMIYKINIVYMHAIASYRIICSIILNRYVAVNLLHIPWGQGNGHAILMGHSTNI